MSLLTAIFKAIKCHDLNHELTCMALEARIQTGKLNIQNNNHKNTEQL